MPHFLRFSRCIVVCVLSFWLIAAAVAQLKTPPTKAAAADRPELALQIGHSQLILALKYSPDGLLLASGSQDNSVKIWDAQTREVIRTLEGHTAPVRGVAFSPDGKTLATGDEDGYLKIWNPQTGALVRQWARLNFGVRGLAYSPDGRFLSAACGIRGTGAKRDNRGQWVMWDVRNWKVLHRPIFEDALISVAFAPDGKTLALGNAIRNASTEGRKATIDVIIRDTITGVARLTIPGNKGAPAALAFSPDGSILAVPHGNLVELWDVSRGVLQQVLADPKIKSILSLAFSPDGGTLVTAGAIRQNNQYPLHLWNVAGGSIREVLPNGGLPQAVAFSPNGTFLASGSHNDLRVHTLDKEKHLSADNGALLSGDRWVTQVAFSRDGKTLANTGSINADILLWDAQTGGLRRVLQAPVDNTLHGTQDLTVVAMKFSPDGATLAAAYSDVNNLNVKTIVIRNSRTGQILRSWTDHSHDYNALVWSPDGRTIATAGQLRPEGNAQGLEEIKLWNARTGALMHVWHGRAGFIAGLAFSPDGLVLASAQSGAPWKRGQPGDNAITLRDVRSGQVLATLSGHTDGISAVVFSPDGKQIASASRDKTIRLWDARSGKLVRVLTGHTDWVRSVAFSPDGKSLVSGSMDNTLRLWDPATGKSLRVLRGHEGDVVSTFFSPDGKRLASGSTDTTLRLWNAADGRELVSLLTAPPQPGEGAEPGIAGAQIEPLWLAATPQGYYNCAEGADYLIKWRFGDKLLPFYHFEETYRRPDLLERAMRGERIANRPLLITRVPPAIQLLSLANIPNKPGKVRVLIQAADDSELQNSNFQLYVNGVLIPDQVAKPIIVDGKPIVVDGKPIIVDGKPIVVDGKPIIVDGKPIIVDGKPIVVDGKPITADGRAIPGALEVSAVNGSTPSVTASGGGSMASYAFHRLYVMDITLPAEKKVVLRAVVTDNEGNKSDDGLTIQREQIEPRKGNLYVLAIGVSLYRNPLYNISYAAADARSMAATLDGQKGRHYARVQTTVLNDAKANVRNIRAALDSLKAAGPDDTVMVFLSGHGIAARGKTYFAPWGVFVHDLPGTCIEWSEIVGSLSGLYAKKLLFTDACHSGAKLGNWQATSSQLAEAVRRASGIVMFASSQADEFSFEDKEVEQGTFSRALAEGFAGKADIDGDGNITLPELAMYVPKRVSEKTNGLQNPQLVLVQDFNPQTVLTKVDSSFKVSQPVAAVSHSR